MWEQWRAEIDRSMRDAQLAHDRWYDHEFRSELRVDPEEALGHFRLYRERLEVPGSRPPERRAGWWERTFGVVLPRQAR